MTNTCPGRTAIRVRTTSILLLFLSSLTAGVTALGQPPAPAALWEQATIYRDEWGVPHIQADNVLAMAFAFGYAQADDHIEGMLKAYRVAEGRAAEVYGPDYAESDEYALKLGHLEAAQATYPYADPVTRDLCEGFALGVNAWLVDHPGKAPEWADGVRPEEILALMHCFLLSYAPFDLPGVWSRPAASNTGNAWAIGPSRSTTGGTILAINPHTDYRGPFQWYEAQLTVGDFNMAGATLFGIPVIMQGHNAVLGWGLTPNFPDFADVYMEPEPARKPVNPKDPTSILKNADTVRYMQMVANSKTYFVRTPGGLEKRQVPYLDTPRGPIVGKYHGRFCSYEAGGYRDFGALRQFFAMGSARTLAQFKDALALQQLPCFHIIYADREGNIFYLYNAKVGEKYTPPPLPGPMPAANAQNKKPEPNATPQTVNWSLPVPGENPLFNWGAMVPVQNLPAITNPEAGYLQACGNPPWEATERYDMKPDQWPPWFVHDPDTLRAGRVRRLLALGQRSFEDAQSMLYDVLVPVAMYAVPKLKQAVEAHPDWIAQAHPDLPAALQSLDDWNYVAESTSPGMTFFHVWWAALRGMSRQYNEAQVLHALDSNSEESQEFSLRAAEEAAKLMRSEFNSLSVPWGDVHQFVRGDKSVPAPGALSGEPIFVASDTDFDNHIWRVAYGYGYAMVVSFGKDETRAASMVPFGASENPDSPHFADQLALVKERRMKFTVFDPEEVRRVAKAGFGSVVQVAPPGMDAQCTVRSQTPVSVSSSVYAQPPGALPLGLATFTVYARIVQSPVSTPSVLELKVYVAPELCAPENLPRLSVYAYDSTNGWTRLDAQELDPQARVFTCRDHSPRVYAVLGPAEYRLTPDGAIRARIAQTIPDGSAREVLPDATPADGTSRAPEGGGSVVQNPAPAADETVPAPIPAPAPVPLVPQTSGEASGRVRQGAIAWGTKVELRPPGVDGLLNFSAKKAFGARLMVSTDPPQPVPAKMAAFTEFVATECSAKNTKVSVKVSLRVAANVCDEKNFPRLAIYAFEEGKGWTPLSDVVRDVGTHSLSATDDAPRTYAVLGPVECLLKPPEMADSPNPAQPQ